MKNSNNGQPGEAALLLIGHGFVEVLDIDRQVNGQTVSNTLILMILRGDGGLYVWHHVSNPYTVKPKTLSVPASVVWPA